MQVHARPLRRSCDCVGLSRAAWYAPPVDWTVRDAELIAALAKVVEDRPSRGFWKCRALLRRAAGKRLSKRERTALYVPRLPDTVWPVDSTSDAPACGRRFRTVHAVDDFDREALHVAADTSINSHRPPKRRQPCTDVHDQFCDRLLAAMAAVAASAIRHR